MPLDRRSALQLGILILAVPAQYWTQTYFGTSSSLRDYNLKRINECLLNYWEYFLSRDAWEDLYARARVALSSRTSQAMQADESIALEVIDYRNSKGYFAKFLSSLLASLNPSEFMLRQGGPLWFVFQGSPELRSPRPYNVKYRVGQVVENKHEKYRGVIIGWDATVQAPESWIQASIPPEKRQWLFSPAYLILVDSREKSQPQMVYVAEENLDILQRTLVVNPKLDYYFESFDGDRYRPRQRLKVVYPQD